MKTPSSTVLVLLGIGFGLRAAPPPFPYSAVEVDRFLAQKGVDFPAQYQSALAGDIAREISVEYPTVIVLHEGEASNYGRPVLRISGIVTALIPGSPVKRALIGFGAGATRVAALVRFTDSAGGPPILARGLAGNWAATDGLARKIVKLCKAQHFIDSH
jgi:Domain of unknown function (DUF4410)